MAQMVLNLFAYLSERLFITAWNKQRVISKTSAPKWRKRNVTFASTFEKLGAQLGFCAVANLALVRRLHNQRRNRNHTAEARCSFLDWNICQQAQQFRIVRRIGRVAGINHAS